MAIHIIHVQPMKLFDGFQILNRFDSLYDRRHLRHKLLLYRQWVIAAVIMERRILESIP